MHEYRQALSRMRLGASDRDLARAKLVGRHKAKQLRTLAQVHGWLDPNQPLPDLATLAKHLARKASPVQVSDLARYRKEIKSWIENGVQGTTIHAPLQRKYGYLGASFGVYHHISREMAAPLELV